MRSPLKGLDKPQSGIVRIYSAQVCPNNTLRNDMSGTEAEVIVMLGSLSSATFTLTY